MIEVIRNAGNICKCKVCGGDIYINSKYYVLMKEIGKNKYKWDRRHLDCYNY